MTTTGTVTRRAAGALATAAAALALAAPGWAGELRIASGTMSKNALNGGMNRFAELVAEKTGGAYTGKVYEGTLLSFAEMLNGVRDGVVDVGYVIPAYARAQFPQTNLLLDMTTASPDPVIMAGVINDYMFACAECLAEFKAVNHVFLGFTTAGPYYLISKSRIADPADFPGKTIRGLGAMGRWVEAMGGKAVVMSSNDVYEAMNQGQIDGNTHGPDTLKNLSLGEVADYMLNDPVGLFLGSAMFDTNRDLWDELTPEQKRAFIAAAAEAHAFTTIGYYNENNHFVLHPEDGGVELVEPSEALKAKSAAFKESDLDTVAKLAQEKSGIADAPARVEKVRALVDKWTKLFEGVDASDVAAVAEVYEREVFAKIDPASL